MNPEKMLTDTAKRQARKLDISFAEVVKIARLARPVSGYDWWTHKYEDFLIRKGEGTVHGIILIEQIGKVDPTPRGGDIPRHLLISARDSIRDLLIGTTPQAERENAQYVLEEIRKELA